MAYEQVDVIVEDAVTGEPVEGALVRVYDPPGAVVFSEAHTDNTGRAGFLLYSQEYSMRFYKYQVAFTQPQLFTVLSDPATPGVTLNAFTVKASSMSRPLAADPRLCRCSGYFRDVTGRPRKQLSVAFIGDFRPLVLDGSLVMDERRTIQTDEDGYGCIDLIRGACYSVTIENWEGEQRHVRIPDASSANLPNVLFPVVASISIPSMALAVGEEVEVSPNILDSAGIPLSGTAVGDVMWSVADPAVLSLTVQRTKLVLRGLTQGTTELRAARRDNSIVYIPDAGITGSPALITVG
jgi:hypothetical protein